MNRRKHATNGRPLLQCLAPIARRAFPVVGIVVALLSRPLDDTRAAEPLYTTEGADPSFASLLEKGGFKPGERFADGPVLGSRIMVNKDLMEKQVGKAGPIPKDIGIRTQLSGGINRKDFGKWTRWYQEDGNVQVFRLFKGEQSIRDGIGPDGKPGRIEAYSKDVVGTFEPVSFSELPSPRRGLPVPLRDLYRLREAVFQDHVAYQQGLLYFLAHDPRVPKELQERVRRFGLDPNEFKETGHWPHQLYVREARRMVSDYVMTQADCESKRAAEDSVGLASYNMDSHFCQRVAVVEKGRATVRNEGGFGHGIAKPYPVSYRAIVPKREECANLLVPVCLSSTHAAYGSIRMEPVFMILGQSAGAAASLAIEDKIPVQDVNYGKLKERLLAGKQRL
jgi:hypothetical protein